MSAKRQHLGLYVRVQPYNFRHGHVAEFLRALLRHLRGQVMVLWDQGSIHRGPAIVAVQRAYPRLHVEEFPAYAPELNPTEQLWNDWKRHTANSVLRDTGELRRRLYANTRRVRRSQAKLRSCIHASELPLPP